MKSWWAALFALVTSCATIKQKESMETLRDQVDAYNHAFRWKNYPEAATHLPDERRAAFVATYEDQAEGIEIEQLMIGQVNMVNEGYAQVSVMLRYTKLPSITVQKRTSVQHWHSIEGRWVLEKEDNGILNPEEFGAPPKGDDPDHTGDGFDGESTPVELPDVESPDSDLLQFEDSEEDS